MFILAVSYCSISNNGAFVREASVRIGSGCLFYLEGRAGDLNKKLRLRNSTFGIHTWKDFCSKNWFSHLKRPWQLSSFYLCSIPTISHDDEKRERFLFSFSNSFWNSRRKERKRTMEFEIIKFSAIT
ncbi:hypothetical protein CDAR_398131 [Caerostris darwini]|uniref:Uncharacterized protein n=1 Tax=Caerostris darwini TaxID=1538125 RepID=A0AAV4WTB4_9ARAC|nr:hypothetical protein CDAR_398131 [Caerostris darwini]